METRKIVFEILRDYPEARNSDEQVLIKYLVYYSGLQNNNTITFIREHYDFIAGHRRARRYLQNTKGLFPPTEEVKRWRKKKEAKIVEAIREEKRNFASSIYSCAKRIFDKK